MMPTLPLALLVLPILVSAYSYKDHSHYSSVFQETRNFRVYYPPDYDSIGVKTYPVIYYCHGCQGSYRGDQYSSYLGDGAYQHPYNCWGSLPACDQVMNKPYNADFQMFVDSHDVIIVMVDGKIYGAGGCDVWVPYEYNPAWAGGEYRFGLYIRELFGVVDSLYKTKSEPRYRAVSGLSMGGQASLYLAMFNPHLFQSASSFCYSCSFHNIAPPPNTTPTDPQHFWRNYRGLSMRTHANTQDYLGRYSQQMGVLLEGAGFPNEYHLTDFWRHWACDVDSQFEFHMRTFETPKPYPPCFSHTDMYPDFDLWGYTVTSAKAEEGWIFLKDVTKSGFSIYTRYRFPYGKSLSQFPITLKTPAFYQANSEYELSAYDYRLDSVLVSTVTADDSGAITVADPGGLGRDYGLSGNGLEPAVTLLSDTVNETIWLRAGADSALSFDVINLGPSPLGNVSVLVKTDNAFLEVAGTHGVISSLPSRTRVSLDTLAVIRGSYAKWENIGYIKVYFTVDGDTLDKEHILQVHVMDSLPWYDSTKVTIYEGGNIARTLDTGKVYSIWVTYPYQDVPNNYFMTAPIVPVNGRNHPDVAFVDYAHWGLNRAREIVEAKFRVNRAPTPAAPIVLPFMVELNYMDDSPGSDKGIDENVYRYGKIVFPFSAIGVEEAALGAGLPASVVVSPNPFNPATKIIVTMPQGLLPQEMAVYAADGRKVRAFAPKSLGTRGELTWDGKDGNGAPLPSGLYVFRARAQGKSLQKAVVYLK